MISHGRTALTERVYEKRRREKSAPPFKKYGQMACKPGSVLTIQTVFGQERPG